MSLEKLGKLNKATSYELAMHNHKVNTAIFEEKRPSKLKKKTRKVFDEEEMKGRRKNASALNSKVDCEFALFAL